MILSSSQKASRCWDEFLTPIIEDSVDGEIQFTFRSDYANRILLVNYNESDVLSPEFTTKVGSAIFRCVWSVRKGVRP